MKTLLKKLFRSLGYSVTKFIPGSDSQHGLQLSLSNVKSPVIFDVGAHHGETATVFSKLFPNAKLYCFEPFPQSYDKLRFNSAAYQHARLVPMGFSNANGIQAFYVNESDATNSLLALEDSACMTWSLDKLKQVNAIECNFQTIDSYMATEQIARIDLLKLDVQGAEMLVLEGATESLREGKISHIYLEIITAKTYTSQKSMAEYMSMLDLFGYRIRGMYNLEYGKEGDLLQLDALFSKDR